MGVVDNIDNRDGAFRQRKKEHETEPWKALDDERQSGQKVTEKQPPRPFPWPRPSAAVHRLGRRPLRGRLERPFLLGLPPPPPLDDEMANAVDPSGKSFSCIIRSSFISRITSVGSTYRFVATVLLFVFVVVGGWALQTKVWDGCG